MTTRSAPDPLWRRIAECVYVVAVAGSHIVGDMIEAAWLDTRDRIKARRRRRIISVTRRKV